MKPLRKPKLAIILSQLEGFRSPKEGLEQYETPSEIAAEVLWNAAMQGDVVGKEVLDLGAGTGFLGLGAMLLGAGRVTLVDRDSDALDIAKTNILKLRSEGYLGDKASIELLCAPVEEFKGGGEVAIMNPPFGARMRQHDREFINKALECAPIAYSFLKSETLPFWKVFLDGKARITHAWRFKYPLKATRAHHRRRIQYIDVSCIRFERL